MTFIYPELKNHESVNYFPSIRGLQTNLFFFDHRFPEENNDMMQSKFNIKEAEIIVRFAWYLIQQKYKPEKITILTLYIGQLLRMKKLILDNPLYSKSLKYIKVITVDSYQGEENDIILLSMVRSNLQNSIGFLD